jgi:hypothetical protein
LVPLILHSALDCDDRSRRTNEYLSDSHPQRFPSKECGPLHTVGLG